MGKSYEPINGVLGFLCLVLLMGKSGAYDFVVGGQKGWTVPSDPNFNPYNTWAEKSRFQIGDSLVFNYNSGQDSVLEVKSEDYANCNTNAPNANKYTDGHTVYKFSHSGHHFFISGNRDNCLKNEKLVVVVLADRAKASNNAPAPSPLASSSTLAPSPPPSTSSPPPSAASPPSPPPSTTSSPPAPSPTTTTGTTPTPAPVSGPPPSHANGASSVFCTFAGTAGAFMASTLILSF